ncbi:UDP-N-acetylmuramoylalanyl-D-glutamate--2,6-diaminopimelate ligase [Niabella ginsenosidivorans]|uniref:UDP-N-acetylmuramoyl-tripeptide--D-alanyl-D-alanine ligase n=1 Tax=Niabella ginsenosidivorans TaxID=1176587 RepID=A0A1A9IBS2_9BACT|nr:UDP-N-acetylmuramoyl-tripeptide--D-alanyl-D-alanine ligase [Niabella ginsenosidivorans]ANH84014.1 UDP-N-acetylmuramoylalanyl-D-glutamate--2,6-diaminopimelate ligase [Niabella ginsenosidivorans]
MNIEEIYQVYLQHPDVQTDTRKIKEGELFFALKGPNFNGNSFAQQAVDAGAARVIIDEAAYEIPGKTILVDDVLTTLQQLAAHHRDQFRFPVIAITGSNGKTTTKELIHAVLSSTYKTYTTTGNLNNHIGVPLTLLKIRDDAQMAVIEMGANHLLEIKGYCRVAKPTHGLITNVGKAHLEGFGSLEGVKKGKGELYDFLRERGDGTAFVMWDYDYLRAMSRGIATIVSYGTGEADVVGAAKGHTAFLEVNFIKPATTTIQTQLVGDYNLPNVLAATAIGDYFNIPMEKIKRAIEQYTPSNSRSQLLEKGSNKIILDAYNANPSSMKLAIENFADRAGSNKMLLLGAMAEMGAASVAEHESIVELIRRYKWQNVVLVGKPFAPYANEFNCFESSDKAAEWMKGHKPENTLLLIKGSRSTQMEKILEVL